MKLQELNLTELKETNGGFIFGNSNSSMGGLGIGLGLDNLLSFHTESHDGDESSMTSFSLGNGLGVMLEGLFSSRD